MYFVKSVISPLLYLSLVFIFSMVHWDRALVALIAFASICWLLAFKIRTSKRQAVLVHTAAKK